MTLIVANKDGLYVDRRTIDDKHVVSSGTKFLKIINTETNELVGAVAFCGRLPDEYKTTLTCLCCSICELVSTIEAFKKVDELSDYICFFQAALNVHVADLCRCLMVERTAGAVLVTKTKTIDILDICENVMDESLNFNNKLSSDGVAYPHESEVEIVYGSSIEIARILLDHGMPVLDMYRKAGTIDDYIDGNCVDYIARADMSTDVNLGTTNNVLPIILKGLETTRALFTETPRLNGYDKTYQLAVKSLIVIKALCNLESINLKNKRGIKAVLKALKAVQSQIDAVDEVSVNNMVS